jgi:signal transduction histidine kinase
MVPQPTADGGAKLISAARAASAAAILAGGFVLCGWALRLPALESLLPGMATMKINTAISLILGGLALWGHLGAPGRRARSTAYGCAAAVALIGLLTLLEYTFGWNIGIDQAPLPAAPATSDAIGTSRMAPATALLFLLIGSALLLLDMRHGQMVSRRLTYGALAIALLALVGYLYDVRSLYMITPYSSITLHTALTFTVLCVGMLCARPDRGALAVLAGQGAGSALMRRLLPAAIGVPLMLGWLRLAGERAGLYDTTFGLALFALLNIVVFATLVWHNALYLNHADHARRQAEQRIQRFTEALEQRVIERTTQLTAANHELEQANLAKDRFLANMSHELRTPLNAIIGFTGTLLMRLPGPLTADQERQLTTIQSSARHLLALISDVLDLSRIEASKRELYVEPVACQDVIAELIDSLRPSATAKGIGLKSDLPQQEIILLTDRRALSQILLNLVNNAIKFTDHGQVSVGVRTERRELRAESAQSILVVFSVCDTGIGIRKEDQTKLFQVFTQIDASSSRSYEGTGLGLYLCQKLAALLGGWIRCESEYGKGSTFTLLLAEQAHIPVDHDRHGNIATEIERS